MRVTAAVIPPRVPHGHGACSRGALLFLDGDEPVSRELSRGAAHRCETWRRDAFDLDVALSPTPERARPPRVHPPRARRAIAAVEEGASLSAAAASAGFADRAHLSRVFREQFGVTPTQALGSITWRTLD